MQQVKKAFKNGWKPQRSKTRREKKQTARAYRALALGSSHFVENRRTLASADHKTRKNVQVSASHLVIERNLGGKRNPPARICPQTVCAGVFFWGCLYVQLSLVTGVRLRELIAHIIARNIRGGQRGPRREPRRGISFIARSERVAPARHRGPEYLSFMLQSTTRHG